MDYEIERKQTYLRESILNKGYSADEFMSFLSSKKGDMGLDLNNWTMDELKQIVSEFISLKMEMIFSDPLQQLQNPKNEDKKRKKKSVKIKKRIVIKIKIIKTKMKWPKKIKNIWKLNYKQYLNQNSFNV